MAGAKDCGKVGQARKYLSARTNAIPVLTAERAFRSFADDLRQAARMVYGIHDPMRSNPERVFELKDEIAKSLEALAREVEASHG